MSDLMLLKFKPVEEYLLWVPDPRGTALRLYHKVNYLFNQTRGSSGNHHWWVGGYRDHLTQVFNLAEMIVSSMFYQSLPKPPWESIVLAVYFHDIEKQYKYVEGGEFRLTRDEFLRTVLPETFDLVLTDEELDAIKYAHGEGDDYRKDKRVMSPLAAIVHAADVLSARWLFDRRVDETGSLTSVPQ